MRFTHPHPCQCPIKINRSEAISIHSHTKKPTRPSNKDTPVKYNLYVYICANPYKYFQTFSPKEEMDLKKKCVNK